MKKFIVLGLDGAIPGIINEYVQNGVLKNFKRLMEKGVFGTNLPFPSAVTPGNWVSIASGSYPGTNGISDFCVHVPGESYEASHDVFNAEWCNAELIWDSMSQKGQKVATISYPGGRPRRTEGHTSIGDNGMPGENKSPYLLSPARLFTSGRINPLGPYNWKEHECIELMKAVRWVGLPDVYKPQFESRISVKATNPGCSGSLDLFLLIADCSGG